jgi:hypothetical protein
MNEDEAMRVVSGLKPRYEQLHGVVFGQRKRGRNASSFVPETHLHRGGCVTMSRNRNRQLWPTFNWCGFCPMASVALV